MKTPAPPPTVPDQRQAILAELLKKKGVRCFSAKEILFLGAASTAEHPNSPPPIAALSNLAEVAILADELRVFFGSPLMVVSAWRSTGYNRHVGGAPHSLHMRGKAIDLRPSSPTLVPALHRAASRFYEKNPLAGGIGFYDWGVHIDTGGRRSWGDCLG